MDKIDTILEMRKLIDELDVMIRLMERGGEEEWDEWKRNQYEKWKRN
jgi:hypothetical protein